MVKNAIYSILLTCSNFLYNMADKNGQLSAAQMKLGMVCKKAFSTKGISHTKRSALLVIVLKPVDA